jgi:hypothetical protein
MRHAVTTLDAERPARVSLTFLLALVPWMRSAPSRRTLSASVGSATAHGPARRTLRCPPRQQSSVADARERRRRLDGEFGAACEEIYLLGSPEVRQAADHLWDVAHEAMHSAKRGYMVARVAFLEAVRQELGIVTDQRSRAVEEPLPDF